MTEAKEKLLPGIEAYIEPGEKGFSKIKMLLEATGGLSLSQVCAVTGLEGSTIQNWVKRGWVAHPKGKRYEEVHIARILIINALKECIKLEHIALLMNYVSGTKGQSEVLIKESDLFNYLCDALGLMGQASGVEAVVEDVLKDYIGPTFDAKQKIRKALTLMMYACVCTDVKRRTESMMTQVLYELENPSKLKVEVNTETPKAVEPQPDPEPEPEPILEPEIPEAKKTIAQTLREWDVSSVEKIIINHETDDGKLKEEQSKPVNRPWFSRKNVK
ncbi:MAG: DUF1836 domain-containing protein [Oscillospiraceae bacterium]|nr:DUF1836 domain-containing protein [Oscillospiraceae bacterium]